ncbi:hypothetical protein RhiirA1_483574 [Rhizophagus irregularis]|uniref:Uncharacterized protein n=1 Tax=Rhizophagus irregularis TaxID=588596 RepID=A0A2N0QKE4_9GLOM|nr:hypothetical protein RhiirA1_483574 [Rhizophagus irregularis]
MSQIRSYSSLIASYPEFLANVFVPGFAVVDWSLTCLSSVTKVTCRNLGV